MEVTGELHIPGAVPLVKEPQYLLEMGPRTGLDAVE
jgi:hypothetical protein